jgi:hypothetical protein
VSEDIEQQIDALQDLDIEALRQVWRERWRAPPLVRSGEVLRRLIAERLQEAAFGTDDTLGQRLGPLISAQRRGRSVTPLRPKFKPGTLLVREHAGVRHRVEVLEKGFRWNGSVYASLSEIARAITGTRWNGPKFFGLREAA